MPTGGIPAAADYPDFETLKRRWTEIENDLLAYIASLTPDDVNRVVQFKTLAGVPFSQQLAHCLQHSPITAPTIAVRSLPCCASWAQNLSQRT